MVITGIFRVSIDVVYSFPLFDDKCNSYLTLFCVIIPVNIMVELYEQSVNFVNVL